MESGSDSRMTEITVPHGGWDVQPGLNFILISFHRLSSLLERHLESPLRRVDLLYNASVANPVPFWLWTFARSDTLTMNRTATTNHGIAMHGYIRWWIAYRFLVKPLLSWHSSERSSICVRCSLNSASLSNRSISADQRRCLSHYHKLVDFSQIAEGKDRSGVESKPTVCRQEVQKWNACRRALSFRLAARDWFLDWYLLTGLIVLI